MASRVDQVRPGGLSSVERFTEVATQHGTLVLRFLAARVGPDDAEDLLSETMIEAFRARHRFDGARASEKCWLIGIASTILLRHCGREARWNHQLRVATDQLIGERPGVSPMEAMVNATPHRRTLAALGDLPSKLRDVLLLHAIGELDHDEIARTLGIRPGTVKSRLSRARTQVQGLLELHGGSSK